MNLSSTLKLILISEVCACYGMDLGEALMLLRLTEEEINDFVDTRIEHEADGKADPHVQEDDLDFALRFAKRRLTIQEKEMVQLALEDDLDFRLRVAKQRSEEENMRRKLGELVGRLEGLRKIRGGEGQGKGKEGDGDGEWYVDVDPVRVELDAGELTMWKWHVTVRKGIGDEEEWFIDPRMLSWMRMG